MMNVKPLPDSNNLTGSISGRSSLSLDQSVTSNEIYIPGQAKTIKGKYLSFQVKFFSIKSEKVIVCKNDDCNYENTNTRTFSKHLSSHIAYKDKLDYFHCVQSKCTTKRAFLNKLIKHQENHIPNKTKLYNYRCDVCKFKTNSLTILETHNETKTHCEIVKEHESQKIGSTSQDTLINHELNIQSHNCRYCSFTTPNIYILIKHNKTQHEQEKYKYFCQMCDFKSDDKTYFLQHQKTKKHLKRQVIEQQLSGKIDQTQVARELKKHGVRKDSQTKFNFLCDKCAYMTYDNSMLNQHMIVHLSDEEQKKFKCDQCPYKTGLKSNLYRHKKTCKAINCDQYGSAAPFKSNLQTHKKTHVSNTKRKVHKCNQSLCDFTTYHKYSLKRHIKRIHMIENEKKINDTNESTSSRKRKHSPERNVPTESVVFIKSEPASAHIFDAKHRIDNQTPLWFSEPSIKQEVSESEVADHGLTFFSELPIEFRELPPQVSYQVKSDIRQAIKHYKELDNQAREQYLNERMTKQKSNGMIIRALEGQDEVIATRDIKQYELLGHYAGMTRSQTSYDKGADAMGFSLINIDRYSFNASSKQLISGFRQGNITSLINSHTNYGAVENDSSVPEQNVAFLRHLDKKNKWVVFILAIKDIDKDAQLWIDYGPNYWEAMNETIELDNNDIEPIQ